MRGLCITGLIVCLLLATAGFAQEGINASLSGTVADPTGALIPGVEVTAKNTATGVASTAITNETGTYRFPSLQPGSYEATAVLTGFSTQSFRLTLGTSQQIRQNFTLQVGTVAQAVEVTAAADALLTAATASVGTVLPATQVVDLPLVGRNVMDLVTSTMPGVSRQRHREHDIWRSFGQRLGECRHLARRRHNEYRPAHPGAEAHLLRQSRPGRRNASGSCALLTSRAAAPRKSRCAQGAEPTSFGAQQRGTSATPN